MVFKNKIANLENHVYESKRSCEISACVALTTDQQKSLYSSQSESGRKDNDQSWPASIYINKKHTEGGFYTGG